MDEQNQPSYYGEEHHYQPSDHRAGKITEPSFRRKQRLIPILIGIITILAVVLGLVVWSFLTAVPPNSTGGLAAVTATATPTPTPIPTPTPTPTPMPTVMPTATPTAIPTPIAILPCVVNVGTWTGGSADWKSLNGTLLNDGTNYNHNYSNGPTIVAHCPLGNTTNYAVETKIQVTSGRGYFGITVRGSSASRNWQGYMASVRNHSYNKYAYLSGPGLQDDSFYRSRSFDPGTNLRTYRVEANGNIIKFLIDGNLLLTLEDNRYLTGSQVGLWSAGVQLQVTSFEVTSL